jgi:hypothetical protein
LPDTLLSAEVYYGRNTAKASDYDFGAGAFTGSYNRNQSGSSKSSFSINGDLSFRIQKGFDGFIPGFEHIFFIEVGNDGSVTSGEVLTKLNQLEQSKGSSIIYKNWPYIQLISETVVVITGGKSKSNNSSISQSASINGSSSSQGKGESYDVNVNVNVVNIPETLHGQINIRESFIGAKPDSDLDVNYGVRPEILAPTFAKINGQRVNCPEFPVGNYLLSSTIDLYKWGFVKVTARTVAITQDYI